MKTIYFVISVALIILLSGCSDEEQLKKLFAQELAQVKKANAAHVKIINDKDAQLYKAEILNARTQGLISIQLANDALDTLRVQSELFPKLSPTDSAKIVKEIADIKALPTYSKKLLEQDTKDIMALNIQLPGDIAAYDDSQVALLKTQGKIQKTALKDAKVYDEDASWWGFGRLIHGIEDSTTKLVIFGGSFLLLALLASLVLSVYPPTAPIGLIVWSGVKLGFTITIKAIYYLIVWPVVTLVQVGLNSLQTVQTQTK